MSGLNLLKEQRISRGIQKQKIYRIVNMILKWHIRYWKIIIWI